MTLLLKKRLSKDLTDSTSSSSSSPPLPKKAKVISPISISSLSNLEMAHLMLIHAQQQTSSSTTHHVQQSAAAQPSSSESRRVVSPSCVRSLSRQPSPTVSSISSPSSSSSTSSSSYNDYSMGDIHIPSPDESLPFKEQNPLEMLSNVTSLIASADHHRLPPSLKRRFKYSHPIVHRRIVVDSATGTNHNNKRVSNEQYVGQRHPRTNQRHGKGIMMYSNGCKYIGTFMNDKRHGYGKCYYPPPSTASTLHTTSQYTGQWKHNKKHGHGKMVYPNGDIYQGSFYNDVMHGYGKLFVLNDENRKDYDHVYKGTFVNGKKCGQGVIQYSNGDVYKGTFDNDFKHGEGYLYTNGTVERLVYYMGLLV